MLPTKDTNANKVELNKNKLSAQDSPKTLKRNGGTTAPKNESQ